MKAIQVVTAILFVLIGPVDAEIRYAVQVALNSLPNYDKNTPFTEIDKAQHAELKQAIPEVKASNKDCKAGSVLVQKAPLYPGDASGRDWRVDLSSNICDVVKLNNIRRLVVNLAPTLSIDNVTAWLFDVDGDQKKDLIVGYIDVSRDESKYPYLSLWRLKLERGVYKAYYAGPFLNGTIHAAHRFGNKPTKQTIFVKHASCIECEPTIFLTALDFDGGSDVRVYEFSYDEKHERYDSTIEYELPGMGHTVDAKVETRVLPPSETGPHLLQFFDMEEGPDEWWVFTCKDYKCDFQLYKSIAPNNFKQLWNKAKRL